MGNAGKKVKVHYVGTLDDGTEFDSSLKRGEPIEFVCMAGMMIPGFDRAVEDMIVGQKKYVKIPAEDAYGPYEESLVQRIPVNQIPNGEALPVGQTVYMQTPAGQPLPVKVVEIVDGVVTLDMNHEMAGKDLNFEISLMEVLEDDGGTQDDDDHHERDGRDDDDDDNDDRRDHDDDGHDDEDDD